MRTILILLGVISAIGLGMYIMAVTLLSHFCAGTMTSFVENGKRTCTWDFTEDFTRLIDGTHRFCIFKIENK